MAGRTNRFSGRPPSSLSDRPPARNDVVRSMLGETIEAAANGNGSGPRRKAVILAGGRGTRLAPYTSVLPKPLMPIGDRSILEIVIGQLAASGFGEIVLCVGY